MRSFVVYVWAAAPAAQAATPLVRGARPLRVELTRSQLFRSGRSGRKSSRSAFDGFLAQTACSWDRPRRGAQARLDPFAAPFGYDRYLRIPACVD